MPDLKILEKDGYVELEDVMGAIKEGALNIKKLWALCGKGDTEEAALTLFEGGFGEDGEEPGHIRNIIVISQPDDMNGEFYRIWLKSTFNVKPKRRR